MARSTLPSLEIPIWLSPGVTLVVTRHDRDSVSGEARSGRRRLARFLWTTGGLLQHETPLDARGREHGLQIERDDEGKIAWCAQWSHGKQHGLTMQLGRGGRPLLVTEFVRGRGTDIWTSGCAGPAHAGVSEVRELADDRLNGWIRWGNPRRPWEEEHYRRGERHGITRVWKDNELSAGYPQFFVRGVRVSRRAYRAAEAADPTLPRYLEQDNVNARPLPEVVRAALARAKELRRALAFLGQLRRRGAIRPGTVQARSIAKPRRRR
jgi:hypothetical protein